MLKEIFDLYNNIKDEWHRMRVNADFSYDTKSFLGVRRKYNLRRQEKDRLFWNKVDDYIDNVLKPDFPVYQSFQKRFR